ncbi:hypothetical protein A9D60_17385 [Leisingera sp. JC1]|nr:hypothetical protein A9D60_17385 [Leisingera sp. JC1]
MELFQCSFRPGAGSEKLPDANSTLLDCIQSLLKAVTELVILPFERASFHLVSKVLKVLSNGPIAHAAIRSFHYLAVKLLPEFSMCSHFFQAIL